MSAKKKTTKKSQTTSKKTSYAWLFPFDPPKLKSVQAFLILVIILAVGAFLAMVMLTLLPV